MGSVDDVTGQRDHLLYLLLDACLTIARQIREFCTRAAERLGPGEDRVKYNHTFGPGDPDNMALWTRWEATSPRSRTTSWPCRTDVTAPRSQDTALTVEEHPTFSKRE